MKKVVVTGIGIISPVGNSIPEAWKNISEGKSGITGITKFDASAMRTKIAGEVKNFDPAALIEQKEIKKMDEFIQYSIFAADEALRDSGLEINESTEKDVGTIIGVGIGGLPMIEKTSIRLHEKGPNKITPFFIPMCIGNLAAGFISIRCGAKNCSFAVTSACASSNNAILTATRMIQNGEAKAMIAGGTEGTINPISVAGFGAMKALSTRNDEPEKASRPYDRQRDGFVLGEGSGVLILEEEEFAKRRNARIYGEVLGGASTADAFHITMPTTEGPAEAMKKALIDSGVNGSEVDYINTHGTSTPAGDLNEITAIKQALGESASKNVSISSTKSMTGHLLGGSGGIESVFCLLAMKHGLVPPTINIDELDPECDLDVTPNTAKERQIDVILNNSFGFGGTNCTIVFKRYCPCRPFKKNLRFF